MSCTLTGLIGAAGLHEARIIWGNEPLGVSLDRWETAAPPRAAEQVQVPLAGTEELQETHTPVPTGVAEAEKYQVILQPRLPHHPRSALPVVPKLPNRVLRIVVVPGHAVVFQK